MQLTHKGNGRNLGKFVLVTSCWVHVRVTEDTPGNSL